MFALPSASARVPFHTPASINARIARKTHQRLDHLSSAGPELLQYRLQQLDREWDTERILETNASLLVLAGLLLGKVSDRRWYLLSAGVAAFLLEHALQGWCPPLPIIRALGARTPYEIERERAAVQALLSGE